MKKKNIELGINNIEDIDRHKTTYAEMPEKLFYGNENVGESVVMVMVKHIIPSDSNPRTIFNDIEDGELADSIKQLGIVDPLKIRSLPKTKGGVGTFDLIDGERRYRAALKLGLDIVPCIILNIDDEQAYLYKMVSSLQKANLHYLDEAISLRTLEVKGYTKTEIAKIIGKSVSYVEKRIKLNLLIDEFYQDCTDNKFTVSQALLLARLNRDDQQRIFKGLGPMLYAMTPGEIKLMLDKAHKLMSNAIFDTMDPSVTETILGSCKNCQFRTGNNVDLFNDYTDDVCTFVDCFDAKTRKFIDNKFDKLTAEGKKVERISESIHYDYEDALPRTKYVTKAQLQFDDAVLLETAKKDKIDLVTIGIYVDGKNIGKTVDIVMVKDIKKYRQEKYDKPKLSENENKVRSKDSKLIEKQKLKQLQEQKQKDIDKCAQMLAVKDFIVSKCSKLNQSEVKDALAYMLIQNIGHNLERDYVPVIVDAFQLKKVDVKNYLNPKRTIAYAEHDRTVKLIVKELSRIKTVPDYYFLLKLCLCLEGIKEDLEKFFAFNKPSFRNSFYHAAKMQVELEHKAKDTKE